MNALRRFGWRLAGGLAVAVIALVLFVQQLSPDFYKARLARAVAESTGRKLTVEGPLSVAWWPQLRVHASGITLDNAPAFGPEPMLTAQELDVAVSTLPLLIGRISMETARVRGLSLKLVRRADGSTNWDDLTRKDEAAGNEAGALAALALGGVDIEDARVSWQDQLSGRELTLQDLQARTGALAFDTPVDFRVSARLRASKPALEGETTFDGTVTYTPRRQRYRFDPLHVGMTLAGKALPGGKSTLSVSTQLDVDVRHHAVAMRELKLEGLGTQLAGEVALDNLDRALPGGQVRLALSTTDLMQVLRAFDLPGTAELAAARNRSVKLELEGSVDADQQSLRIPTLSLQALGATLEGRIALARLAAPTALQGTLTAKGPDLPLLLALANQWAGGDARGAVLLQRALAGGGREFSFDTEVDADLGADRPALPRLQARVLGTTLEASLAPATLPGGDAGFAGQLAASGENLALLKLALAAVRGAGPGELAALLASDTPAPERRFSLRTALEADPAADRYAAQQLDLSWLQVQLGGNLEARGLKSGTPAVKGHVSAKGTSLPAVMGRLGLLEPGSRTLHELAPADLRAFTLQGDFSADAKTGEFGVTSLEADALGFRLAGKLGATRSEKSGLRYDGQLEVEGHTPGPLLLALGGQPLLGQVENARLEAGFKGQDGTLLLSPLTMGARVAGLNKAEGITLTATAEGAELALARNALSIKRAALAAGPLKGSAGLDVVQDTNGVQLSGQLNVPPFDLRALLSALGVPVPTTRHAATFTSVGLDTAFRFDGHGIALGKLSARIDDTALRGSVEAKDLAPPDLQFALSGDRLDLDRYLPANANAKAKPVSPETALVALAQLPATELRRLRLKGELALEQLTTLGLKLADVNLQASAEEGEIALEPVTAELYQGKYRGVAKLDMTGDTPQLSVKSDLARVALEPLMADLAGRRDLTGSMNFEARLTGSGATPAALQKSLAGQATFAVHNGALRGVDVPAIVGAGRLLLSGKLPARLPTGGETAFKTFSGTLELRDGVIANQDLQLDGEGFNVRGSGTVVRLADTSMNYEARVTLGRDGPEIPVRCRGPLAGSSCQPDFKALGQRKLAKPLGTVVKKLKDELRSKAVESTRKAP